MYNLHLTFMSNPPNTIVSEHITVNHDGLITADDIINGLAAKTDEDVIPTLIPKYFVNTGTHILFHFDMADDDNFEATFLIGKAEFE